MNGLIDSIGLVAGLIAVHIIQADRDSITPVCRDGQRNLSGTLFRGFV